MSKILIDPKLGVNPTRCYCPICGGETNTIAIPGRMGVYECDWCHVTNYGSKGGCGKCQGHLSLLRWFDGSREKLPDSQPCDRCAKILKTGSLLICNGCRKMYNCSPVKMLCSIEMDHHPTDEEIDQFVKEGKAVRIVGKVFHDKDCEACRQKEDAA